MNMLTWKQLASIEVGGAICLPIVMVGHKMCSLYGWYSALVGILIANLLLFAMACMTVFMSVENRNSTPENAKRYFGEKGTKLFALLLLMAKISWFAIQLNMMVLSIQEIFHISIEIPLTVLLGCIILAVALRGLTALSRLSCFSLPILIVTMGAALILADQRKEALQVEFFSWGSISIAIGAAITAVIDMPTYFRHARSTREGLLAVGILFLIAVPLIEGVGVYLAHHNPGGTVIDTLMKPNYLMWNIWVMLFMVLAGWTTNNTNLYSAAVSLESIWKNSHEKLRITAVAMIGTMLALAHVFDHLTFFLQMLGICMGSMGAVILTNYISKRECDLRFSFMAWGLGVLIGLLNIFHIATLTPIAVLDSFLIASIFTFLGKCYEIINCRSIG
jgi:cytosine permease